MHILSQPVIAGNELWRLMLLFGAILVMLAAGRLTRYLLSAAAARAATDSRSPVMAALLGALARSAGIVAFALGLNAGMFFLNLTEHTARVGGPGRRRFVRLRPGFHGYCLVDAVDSWLAAAAARTASKLDDMLVPMVRKSLRVTLVILVVAQVGQSLSDKPVSSILAGLGVGSLAVALAAKDTVSNFFGSLVILSDKPFELGQLIKVGSTTGTVESLGFRSTRLRTLDGHFGDFSQRRTGK